MASKFREVKAISEQLDRSFPPASRTQGHGYYEAEWVKTADALNTGDFGTAEALAVAALETVRKEKAYAEAMAACGPSYPRASEFMARVQGLVAAGDWSGLSSAVTYPLRVPGDHAEMPYISGEVKDATTFVANAPAVSSPAILAAIAKGDPKTVVCNRQGFALGNGVLWAATDASGRVALTSVNKPVDGVVRCNPVAFSRANGFSGTMNNPSVAALGDLNDDGQPEITLDVPPMCNGVIGCDHDIHVLEAQPTPTCFREVLQGQNLVITVASTKTLGWKDLNVVGLERGVGQGGRPGPDHRVSLVGAYDGQKYVLTVKMSAAEKQAKEHGACVSKCTSMCNGDSGCVATCVHQSCP